MKRGKIELASGGTLFLDEIGDLDLELQAKLLKVLEQKSIQRVGSSRETPVDVRIVAATHKNLQEAVNNNRFRLDLFYRLNIFPIRLPPLRARQGDVLILARYFLNAANQEYGRNVSFGPGAIETLDGYPWPGNIRQLENLIKRAVLMSVDGTVPHDLVKQILIDEEGVNSPDNTALSTDRAALSGFGQPAHADAGAGAALADGLRPYIKVRGDEGGAILDALAKHQGNKTRAAMSLGMTPRQLRYRIQKLGLST